MSSDSAQNTVRRLLESADVGDATGAPTPEQARTPELWDKAYATYRELRQLHAKRDALFQELGYSLAWRRAMAHAGLPVDGAHPVRAEDVASTDFSTNVAAAPPGSAMRRVWARFKMRFPSAIVGARTADGRVVLFREPFSRPPAPDVPTYEELAAKIDAAAAQGR